MRALISIKKENKTITKTAKQNKRNKSLQIVAKK